MPYTFLICKRSAAKFQTPEEWLKADPMAYDAAELKGWLDRCTAHMSTATEEVAVVHDVIATPAALESEPLKREPVKEEQVQDRTLERCDSACGTVNSDKEVCDKPISSMSLDERAVARQRRREQSKAKALGSGVVVPKKEVDAPRQGNPRRRGTKWTLQACQQQSLKHKDRDEWAVKHPVSFVIAQRKGWLPLCETQSVSPELTVEHCIFDALRFKTLSAWKAQSILMYGVAKDNGWLNEVKAAFDSKREPERKMILR